jgi:hypothetical protein
LACSLISQVITPQNSSQATNYLGDNNCLSELLFCNNLKQDFDLIAKLFFRQQSREIQLTDTNSKYGNLSVAKKALGGSLGVQSSRLFFSMFLSQVDLNGNGALYGGFLPDLLPNLLNVDKSIDYNASLVSTGFQIGFAGQASKQIAYQTDCRIVTAGLTGIANQYTNYMFGVAKQLDKTYNLEVNRIDFANFGGEINWQPTEKWEVHYSLQQAFPIAIHSNESPGLTLNNISSLQGIDAANGSGGFSQLISFRYYI